ncbi:heterokaryon incompatibility protein-domain-containing protein [Xylariaceae sp. AK1471]|nr:heterokaryon incompatibility protein-domain-containing protein [Xylariaceae sp. AK1471]
MAIRLVDTTSLRLETFTGRSVPPYAILSHTWENDQEILFQEMMSIDKNPHHPATKKSGYRKIVQTCAKAAKHGYHYAWIDTCCIDKTSSAELSEAINSMYKWYKQAGVCYVFLSDFEPGHLSSCKWFTRGWCLQELIAPRNLRLYDCDWTYIGSKVGLQSEISNITGIELGVLLDGRLISTISIAQRMSWASFRETTREEDIAYCLLGIFDVNMPMIYGEGTKAFMRLQEEIIKKSNDLSIFAFRASRSGINRSMDSEPVYFNLFATSPYEFKYCGNLFQARNGVVRRRVFSLTNNGLHFRQVELELDVRQGVYIMDLMCSTPNILANLRLLLRKVGPAIFAAVGRLQHTHYDISSQMKTETAEAYIVTTITGSLADEFKRADEFAIRISPGFILQDANPSDQWDASRRLFLTSGTTPFEGYLKVYPGLTESLGGDESVLAVLAKDLEEDNEVGHCFLACGLDRAARDPTRIVPWVRLFSAEEWRKLKAGYGQLVGLEYLSSSPNLNSERKYAPRDGLRDKLTMGTGSIILSAQVKEFKVSDNKRAFQVILTKNEYNDRLRGAI